MKKNGMLLTGLLLAAFLAAGGLEARQGAAPRLFFARAAAASLEETGQDAALQARYDAAQALFDAQAYKQAYEAFEALGDFSDSRARAAASRRKWKAASYKEAKALYEDGQYVQAKALFEALDDYEKSRSYVRECTWRIARDEYQQAKALYDAGDYEGAKALFEALGSFRDSAERAQVAGDRLEAQRQAAREQEWYEKGLALKEAGDLAGARDAFIEAGDCQDATSQLYAVVHTLTLRDAYEKARGYLDGGAYESAYHLFLALEDYENSAEKAALAQEALCAAMYEQAASARIAASHSRAYILFLYLDGYQDSAALAAGLAAQTTPSTVYDAANALEQEGRYALARRGFEAAGEYEDSRERAALLGETVRNTETFRRAVALSEVGEQAQANALFEGLKDFQNASLHIWPVASFSAKQLRDDKTSPKSPVFTAPDGTRHRYQIFKGVRTWVEAKVFCEVLGGHLATLATAEENDFVYGFMRECGYLTAYFGLSDEKRTGDWIWVTGEPLAFTNWHRGEPSRSGRERYGMYFYKHTDGTWNDSHFYEDAEVDPGCSFICEWDE